MGARTILAALLMLLVVSQAERATAAAAQLSVLAIESGDRIHQFAVEVAATPEQQARGLMYRRSMDSDEGMLFPFPQPRPAHFWMRNTYISLDLVFIAPDGRIESIHADAVPLDEATISSRGAVIAVLEVLAGETARRGIAPGDRVRHPALSIHTGSQEDGSGGKRR